MLKNITFSADPELIEKARRTAEANHSTLNNEFRNWLVKFTNKTASESDIRDLLARMSYVKPGKHFTREEMNER
jgi:hypothetical protein